MKYSEDEKKLNNILVYNFKESEKIKKELKEIEIQKNIKETEELIKSLNYNIKVPIKKENIPSNKKKLKLQSIDELYEESILSIGVNHSLEELFSKEELEENKKYIKKLNDEFKNIYKLDKIDYSIVALAGLLAGAIDILMIGIPKKTSSSLNSGKLSDFIRENFNKHFSSEKIKELENMKESKVPFDAQDNRNTSIRVEGLSTYYHRLLALGHDPLLGFVVGVFDILTGKMTTIDKKGKIVSQIMKNYSDRKETNIFAAIAKEILHLKSDVATSMGLPVPLMGLFNLFQFGNIGDENQTIAEIVQGMYYEGYDFIHFCSMSIPVMLIEIIVRLFYSLRKINEGNSIKDSLPFSLNRIKNPKLATMLFLAHSLSTSINTGRIYFSKNPMSINYPQWIAFAKYSYSQVKWGIFDKPLLQEKYVMNDINNELMEIYKNIDTFYEFV